MASISSKSTPAFHGHEALVADAEEVAGAVAVEAVDEEAVDEEAVDEEAEEDAEAEAVVEAEVSEEGSPVAVRRGTGSSATPPKPSV